MIRFILLITFVLNFTYASSEKYFIQFGSFKNLKGLEKNIEKLPSSLRSHVVIVRSNSWYIPFAYYTSNKNALKSKVAAYKRYFKDAHIAHSAYMLRHPLVHNYAIKKSTATVSRRQYVPPVKQYRKVAPAYVPPVRTTLPSYQNVGISEADYTLNSVQHLAPVKVKSIKPKIITQKVVSSLHLAH